MANLGATPKFLILINALPAGRARLKSAGTEPTVPAAD